MIYEIDQSGKVEDTSKDTIICIANNHYQYAILLRKSEKRKLQSYFRERGMIRIFVISVFSALIVTILLKTKIYAAVIDREYYGKEKMIRNMIYDMLKKYEAHISFGLIGKKSPAHFGAYEVLKKRAQADSIITAKMILKTIKKDRAQKTD